ncbi:AAA family ATPase [Chryseobacterium sp. X308]|uniref:AAA family ATPase n=1 Tax=Chryseobacterium sp. X308 TaxID=2884873 RepID=UPI001D1342AF|nr:AAA family ATPase [Chryseobacterium sp. X308]MCC3217170.1 AAA family ATPase [Chryseobacterium sp. X308]
MMQNNLFLKRLVIYTNNGKIAYDEVFHKGVNIICGDNSSGKSTITHFIFFVLGGEFNDFVPEARECQVVYAEIEANGTILTLKRYIEINEKTQNINSRIAIHIFWGNFEESTNPPPQKYWQKYEYNTTPRKKSFSNVLFEVLNFPEVKEENNITMHQILRLLYIDQESPTGSLFYYDEFDKQNKREAVADLLLGIYNQSLYDYKLELYNSEKELEDIKSEIRITKRFFPDNFSLDIEHLNTQIKNKEIEIYNIQSQIQDIRNGIRDIEFDKNTQLEFQKLQDKVIEHRDKVIEFKSDIDLLKKEIIDSEYFIEVLDDKYRSLNNSIQTRDFLGGLPLEYCPECLSKLSEHLDETSCKLCKQTTDDKLGINQAKRMQLEIKFQIDESSKLLKIKRDVLTRKEIEYANENVKLSDLQIKVNNSIIDVRPFELEKLDSLNFEKGLAEGEILQFRTMLEQAQIYGKLLEERSLLEAKIRKLGYTIDGIRKSQNKLKKEVIEKIQEEGVYLLNNDLERQRDFKNADSEDFIIDFSNNLVYLRSPNSEKYKMYQKFSASSNFYLKISARFAIFLASLSNAKMRFPRFIFADNMEDKGIEVARAQNLQKILIDRVNSFPVENFQLIYTTSYITKELKESDYIVGEYHTKDNPSLKNIN